MGITTAAKGVWSSGANPKKDKAVKKRRMCISDEIFIHHCSPMLAGIKTARKNRAVFIFLNFLNDMVKELQITVIFYLLYDNKF